MVKSNRKKTLEAFALGDYAPEMWDIFARIETGPETAQSKRVERVLELLSRLGENPKGIDRVKITSELLSLLRRYRWVTHALVSPTSEGYRAVFRREPHGQNLSRGDGWEYTSVGTLLDLVQIPGAISKLRRCANKDCGKWLFVVQGKRRFCDNNCKQHHFDSDEDHRREKRKYMRDYYAKYGRSIRVGINAGRCVNSFV